MKKIFTLYFLLIAFLAINSSKTFAQTEQFSMGELNPYFSEYLSPFAKAMSVSLSGGWTHTAKVHSTLGFDISFSASIVNIPDADKLFNTSSLTMPNYSFTGDNAPSISAGTDVSAPGISRSFQDLPIADFGFPGITGLGLSKGGMASIQAGIGLPKGTELILRFIPDISKTTNKLLSEVGDIELEKTGMWGIGVKHDIKQWIPVISKVPFLQISGLFTYSKFYTGFSGDDLLFDPARFGITSESLPATTWDNQKFEIGMSSFTGTLLVGANIPVFQPYIGLGFNSASFEGGFNGNYPIIEFTVANPDGTVTDYETDPLQIDTKLANFNFQAGARLKLGPIVFHYTFTQQKYSMHTAGMAVTIR
jgi:hypothetical protein